MAKKKREVKRTFSTELYMQRDETGWYTLYEQPGCILIEMCPAVVHAVFRGIGRLFSKPTDIFPGKRRRVQITFKVLD